MEDIINTNKEEGHYPNTLIPLDHPDRKYYFLVSEKLSLAMIKFLIIQEFQPRWLDGKLLDMVTELNSAVNSSSTRQVRPILILLVQRMSVFSKYCLMSSKENFTLCTRPCMSNLPCTFKSFFLLNKTPCYGERRLNDYVAQW